jgi:hypothetical protein
MAPQVDRTEIRRHRSSNAGPAMTLSEISNLIIRSRRGRGWGYIRIQGALANLGHWNQIVAADCFIVEVWTCRGLTRFVVYFSLIYRYDRLKSAALPFTSSVLGHPRGERQP